MTELVFKIDQAALQSALSAAISNEATTILRQAVSTDKWAETVRSAFHKSWDSNNPSWIDRAIGDAMKYALLDAAAKSIQAAGIEEMMQKAMREYISTPEFMDAAKARAIDVVKEAALFSKPCQ